MDSIIFDIDGTIWNSTDVVAMAWNKALEKENLDVRVTADQLKGLFGRLLPDIAKAILPEQTEAEQLRVIDICCQAEHDLLRAMGAPVYDGLEETLKELTSPVICVQETAGKPRQLISVLLLRNIS